jgi:hypothetical protein
MLQFNHFLRSSSSIHNHVFVKRNLNGFSHKSSNLFFHSGVLQYKSFGNTRILSVHLGKSWNSNQSQIQPFRNFWSFRKQNYKHFEGILRISHTTNLFVSRSTSLDFTYSNRFQFPNEIFPYSAHCPWNSFYILYHTFRKRS